MYAHFNSCDEAAGTVSLQCEESRVLAKVMAVVKPTKDTQTMDHRALEGIIVSAMLLLGTSTRSFVHLHHPALFCSFISDGFRRGR